MMEKQMTNKRVVWVDQVRVFACLMVLLGHLLQGLDSSGIFPNHKLFLWINGTLYAFHVPLFFICSGFLYQRAGNVRNWDSWRKNIVKKLLDLGVPYVTFTTVVWIIKKVLPGAGTNTVLSLWENLAFEPIPPFWFLYALFLCFMVTPTFQSGKALMGLWICSVVAMVAGRKWIPDDFPVGVFGNFISQYLWFLAGMGLAMINPRGIIKAKSLSLALAVAFLGMTYLLRNTNNPIAWLLCSMIACGAIITACYGNEKQGIITEYLASYTMPIFLMHSIFIAVCRSVLIKCGIMDLWLHLWAEILCGLGGPIIAAIVMKKTKYPEFFLQPRKFIKLPE